MRGAESDATLRASVSFDSEEGTPRIRPEICQGADRKPVYEIRDVDDFVGFVQKQGFRTQVARPRIDLALVDVSGGVLTAPLRFRVAILPTPGKAGRELHDALLQHGEGAWGVRRANLAVLAPKAERASVLDFAVRSRLACWGVLTIAALDDAFVVPGGYLEP